MARRDEEVALVILGDGVDVLMLVGSGAEHSRRGLVLLRTHEVVKRLVSGSGATVLGGGVAVRDGNMVNALPGPKLLSSRNVNLLRDANENVAVLGSPDRGQVN